MLSLTERSGAMERETVHLQPPGFFGRQDELRDFAAGLAAARSGEARTFLLAGEPGIGKTRLAEEMAGLAAQAGFLALWGAWRDGARRPEYWAWAQVVRGLLRAHPPQRLGPGLQSALSELSSLAPEIREEMPDLAPSLRDTGKQRGLRLFDAVRRVVTRCCAAQPLLVVFDNLHLSGTASLDLLAGVVCEITACPLIVVATLRDLPVHRKDSLLSFLSDVRARAVVREIRLGPLSAQETAALAAHILSGTPSSRLLQEIWERTRGVPLFVQEATRLIHHEAEHGDAGVERLWKEEIPEALNVAIRLRVRRMSAACVEALRRAAAVGTTFTEEELRLAGDAPGETTLRRLEEAVCHGFLLHGDSPGEYRFSHALIHDAVRLQLPTPDRRALCTALAEAVERTHVGELRPWALRLARWWGEGEGGHARARTRRYLRMAAESALAAGCWEEAIALYEGIADPDLQAADTGEAAAILHGFGSACYRAGQQEKGVRLLQKAFACYKRQGDLESMTRIAADQIYLLVGQPGFYDFFKEILPLLPKGSAAEAGVLHFYGVAQMLSIGDYSRASDIFQQGLEAGTRLGDPVIQARNLAGLAFVDNAHGRYEGCVQRVLQALDLLQGHPDPYAEGHGSYVMSSALMALGRGSEAIAYEDRLLQNANLARDGVQIGSACQLRARPAAMGGFWDEARALCDLGLAACPDHLFLLAFRAFLEYTCGELDAGDSWRGRILAIQKLTPAGPWRAHIQAASTAAVRARNSGEINGLDRCVPQLRAIATYPGAHPFILLRAHLLLAFIAAITNDAGLARGQYQEIQRLPPLQLVRPYLRERFLGLAAHCGGDHGRAVHHLEGALRLARHYGDRPMEAWILCELGEALCSSEAGEETAGQARHRLAEAQDLASALSMPPLQHRAAQELERVSDLLSRGAPAHPHLSQREKQVLELVSSGLTNQLIARELCVSPNTVGNHVCSILAKLGAANRTEAVSRARRMHLIT